MLFCDSHMMYTLAIKLYSLAYAVSLKDYTVALNEYVRLKGGPRGDVSM